MDDVATIAKRAVPLSAIDQLDQIKDTMRTIWLALGNEVDLESCSYLVALRETVNDTTNALENVIKAMGHEGL